MLTLRVKIALTILILLWVVCLFGISNLEEFFIVTLFFGIIIGIILLKRYIKIKSIAKEIIDIENEYNKMKNK